MKKFISMKYFYSLLILIFAFSCTKTLTVDEIIDHSIEAYGGQKVYNSAIEFDFRKKHYLAKYHNHKFILSRTFSDSTGQIVDALTNEGFTRMLNDSIVSLDEEWAGKYSRSVNSVVYFFRIPFILKDEAVKPELLGVATLKDNTYYKIRVSFSEEGGGDDFDDSFIYWVNQENFHIDYFAYSYSTDGGGKRFREAINPRTVNGLYTVDYINYKPKDMKVAIEDYDKYFLEDGMKELSRIENENVSIEYLE
jgi:Family of unknown function (DUF6503)